MLPVTLWGLPRRLPVRLCEMSRCCPAGSGSGFPRSLSVFASGPQLLLVTNYLLLTTSREENSAFLCVEKSPTVNECGRRRCWRLCKRGGNWPPKLSGVRAWAAGNLGGTASVHGHEGPRTSVSFRWKEWGEERRFQICNSFIVNRLRYLWKQSAGIVGTGANLLGRTVSALATQNRLVDLLIEPYDQSPVFVEGWRSQVAGRS